MSPVLRPVLDGVDRLGASDDADHPSQSSADERVLWTPGIDVREFNRGRMIGNLERLLLVIFVVAGSYAAIGFLIAAKGLIRTREFENREYAEYFVIGTLASTLVAVVVGIALRAFFARLGT